MQTINPKKYIDNGLILKNLTDKNLYDCVVYDRFDNQNLDLEEFAINELQSMIDLSTSPGLGVAGKILTLFKQHKRLLFICTEQSVHALFDLLPEIPDDCVLSILSTNHPAQRYDLQLLAGLGIPCADPYDFVSLFSVLEQASKNHISYCRVQPGEYPNMFVGNDEGSDEESLISLIQHGIQGMQGTIISYGRVTNELVHALTKIQELGGGYDCFITTNPFWKISNQLRDSLLNTERLIIVADHSEFMLKAYAQSMLFGQGLHTVEVTVISPDYTEYSSIHPDYLYQQAGFNVEGLFGTLSEE